MSVFSKAIGKQISRSVKNWATKERIKNLLKGFAKNGLIKDLVLMGVDSLKSYVDEPKEREVLATKLNKASDIPVIDEAGEQKIFSDAILGLYKMLCAARLFIEKVEVNEKG